ncbi:MAG: hydroxymethylbilane synthase [Candidatus Eisenbacteria bacterium]|nr:hydroxymethylbilane synthase [Candidatus Latescibacterota bacterium]MBD3302911.1 hydroxymethylbilane synthase [Candidatus Eisenbacteria bacterium]
MRTIRVGTRASRLALWQAEHVASLLRTRPEVSRVEVVEFRTKGDRIQHLPLSKIGGKGLFTLEIEEALHERRVDLAVHSLKDLPTILPEGLMLGAVLSREDPLDAYVSPQGIPFGDLPRGARIGTSSLRRRAQLLFHRSDLEIVDLRGNVPTRLEKTERQNLAGTVLARAGLVRLGLEDRITERIASDTILPAPGQGAIGVEIRSDDEEVRSTLEELESPETRAATDAERGFLEGLGGGCQVPIGALAGPDPEDRSRIRLEGIVAEVSGRTLIRGVRSGDRPAARSLGLSLARRLIDEGAGAILASLQDSEREEE